MNCEGRVNVKKYRPMVRIDRPFCKVDRSLETSFSLARLSGLGFKVIEIYGIMVKDGLNRMA